MFNKSIWNPVTNVKQIFFKKGIRKQGKIENKKIVKQISK